jgi:hypothetical protein
MTLQKQTVGVPLLGLNTVADPKSATAGEFDLVENMFFDRTARGGAELRKRYGGAALSSATVGSGTINAGRRLATFADERLMLGGSNLTSDPGSLFSYSPQQSAWRQATRVANSGQGAAPSIGVVAEVLTGDPNGYAPAADTAVNASNTLLCNAYVSNNSAGSPFGQIEVIDLVTGKRVVHASSVGTVGNGLGWARVIALASVFVVVVGDPVGATVKAFTVTYSTLAISGTTTLITDLNATGKADVTKNPIADEVWIAYHRSGTNDLKFAAFTSALAANGANTSAENPSQAIGWMNWDGSDGKVYLGIVSAATGAKFLSITIATLGVALTTVMDAAVTSAANVVGFVAPASVFAVFIEVRAAATYDALIRYWPGSGATTVYQRSCGIAAGVFKVGSRYFLPITYESSLQSAYYVQDVTSVNTTFAPVTVLRALYGLGGGLTAAGCIGKAGAISATVAGLCVLRVAQNPGGTKILAPCLLRIDFAATSMSTAKRLGDGLHVPGGALRLYDGVACPELGFHVFPETPSLLQGAAGGALTLLGAYQYAVCYVWQDCRGQLHRSAPSAAASITLTGGNNRVTLTIPTLRISQKDGNNPVALVYIEVYRTVAGGTTFFRVNTAVPMTTSSPIGDTQSYVDTASDATISANEILYTTGKILPHIGPPSARLIESWRNRLFLAGTENPLELWVSNEAVAGEGVSFSDVLVLQLEADGGPITALCEMDDRLLIFKRSSIYVLAGTGPTATGDNQYQAPTRLTSIVGAVEQRGVVRTRDGVMFKSTRGIYLIAHTGQIIYVGAGVDAYNSLTVTGSCLLDDMEQVRFTTAEGRTLVYHYGLPDEQGMGRWTTFTGQTAVDCIVWNGKFVRLASDGTVTEETVGSYSDPGGATITAKVRLCWLNLTQFFGRFRLYGIQLLGDLLATFTLTHRIAYDYDATVIESETKAVTVATPVPLQLSPARGRAVAVQVTLEETSTTQGFQVSGWGLEVGVKPGAAKSGAEKRLT